MTNDEGSLNRFNRLVLKLENTHILFDTFKNDFEIKNNKTRNTIIGIVFLILSSIGLIAWGLFD